MSILNRDHRQFSPSIKGVTGVILAGGESRRFGSNKALADINGSRLIERVINLLSPIFEQLIIITNTPEEYSYLQLPTHEDIIKGLGPIGGIYTGLEVIRDEAGFFVACDMPFIKAGLVRHIVEVRDDFQAVVPKIDWKMEALHSLYAKSCLPVIKELVGSGTHQIIKAFYKLRVRYLNEEEIRAHDPLMRSFVNVNSPDELLDAMNFEEE
jgi:molybdenum cofactor guanylyltransferase